MLHQASVDSLLNMSLDEISAEASGGKTGVPLSGDTRRSSPYTRGDSGAKSGGNARLYVGNLSWDTAWQDLKDYFKQAGEVSNVRHTFDASSSACACTNESQLFVNK